MQVRLPLYVKILGWFFLNLLLVAGVVAALFNAQFSLNLDWIMAAGARDRLEAVRDLIVGELEVTPPDDWIEVLDRYSAAYHVRFALFDDAAEPLVGGIASLPAEVAARITSDAAGGPFRRLRPPLRALMRTSSPTHYWLIASARIENPMIGERMRAVLIARANSIGAGGLILDPRPWLAVGLGTVLFSLVFWLPLVRGITRTLNRMMLATRQIADGRFDVRVPTGRRDELGALAESINQMAARLDGLIVGQKRFLGDIAHELCSPLARLQMALGILEQQSHPGQAGAVRLAAQKAEQIASLVGELLSFSKASFGASAIRLEAVPVDAVAEEALHRERVDGVDIRIDVPHDLCVSADADMLVRALGNLLRNAIQHGGAAGPITLSASRTGREVLITVSDSGPGVPPEELPRIFDAFYRLDPTRTLDTGGAGLGLAIVRTCIESCCGSVSARNLQPGLAVDITLHAAETAPAKSPHEIVPRSARDSSPSADPRH